MNSSKSVAEKLNFQKYPTKLIMNIPEGFVEFKELGFDSRIEKDKYNMIFVFIYTLEEFSDYLKLVLEKRLLDNKGYLFFAYPKKKNPRYDTYIDRDSFFDEVPMDEDGYVYDSTIKFARMVSLNEVFTVIGLKSEARKSSKSAKPEKSQRVDDYIHNVEDIRKYLNDKAELLQRYNELTLGYQKDWARYVYSAKKKETQEKRISEMETILSEGFKTIDVYRRQKK